MANEKKTVREPSFILALVPIVAMIAFMLYCFRGHSETGYHDAHLPLVMSIIVACIVGFDLRPLLSRRCSPVWSSVWLLPWKPF